MHRGQANQSGKPGGGGKVNVTESDISILTEKNESELFSQEGLITPETLSFITANITANTT